MAYFIWFGIILLGSVVHNTIHFKYVSIKIFPLVPHIWWTGSELAQVMSCGPLRHQAITWTNAGLLSIGTLWINFSDIWIEVQDFSFIEYIWRFIDELLYGYFSVIHQRQYNDCYCPNCLCYRVINSHNKNCVKKSSRSFQWEGNWTLSAMCPWMVATFKKSSECNWAVSSI